MCLQVFQAIFAFLKIIRNVNAILHMHYSGNQYTKWKSLSSVCAIFAFSWNHWSVHKIKSLSSTAVHNREIVDVKACIRLVLILAGSLFYGTVSFQKMLVSKFFVPLSTNYPSYQSSNAYFLPSKWRQGLTATPPKVGSDGGGDIREGIQPRRNVCGGCFGCVWGGKLSRKINKN